MNVWYVNSPGRWDEHIILQALRGQLWNTPAFQEFRTPPPTNEPIVAVLSHKTPEGTVEQLRKYPHVLAIHTSDESHEWDESVLRGMRTWMGYATPEHHGDRNILIGCPSDTQELLPPRKPLSERKYDWVFSGQVNHPSREHMARVLGTMQGGVCYVAHGFNQGIPRQEHLNLLAEARVAPCPAGNVHPDSFRLYEALEAGALPIVEGEWFWREFNVPFPIVNSWDELPTLAVTQEQANICQAWWARHKRDLAYALVDDAGLKMEQPITVVCVTSPSVLHPSTDLLEQTLKTVRDRLPTAEVLLLCDGVHPELEYLRGKYEEYKRRVLALNLPFVLPIVFTEHLHQSGMLKQVLPMVRTPYILFMEHDVPLMGEIDFSKFLEAFREPEVNSIRLYHYNSIPPEHQYMFGARVEVGGVPLVKTFQWSQRPHIAKTEFYRKVLSQWFFGSERGFIEDKMEAVCRQKGWSGWNGMFVYAPEGDMQRSTHSDGRRGAPKIA